jgi:hypothetical protein
VDFTLRALSLHDLRIACSYDSTRTGKVVGCLTVVAPFDK